MEFNTELLMDFLINPKVEVFLTSWSPPLQSLPGEIKAFNQLGVLFMIHHHAPEKMDHEQPIFLPWHSILWIRSR